MIWTFALAIFSSITQKNRIQILCSTRQSPHLHSPFSISRWQAPTCSILPYNSRPSGPSRPIAACDSSGWGIEPLCRWRRRRRPRRLPRHHSARLLTSRSTRTWLPHGWALVSVPFLPARPPPIPLPSSFGLVLLGVGGENPPQRGFGVLWRPYPPQRIAVGMFWDSCTIGG